MAHHPFRLVHVLLCVTVVSANLGHKIDTSASTSNSGRSPFGPSARCVAHASRGKIAGHAASQPPNDVCEWLGIPYATAPVGDLRFAPPRTLDAKGDLSADAYGPDCPQNPAKLFAYPSKTPQYTSVFTSFASTTSTNHSQSEDCLTLNIWSKPPTESSKLAPVLVWIHGGRHNSGTSNTPFYNGALLSSSQSLVIITFNFRMNIFGFPGAPDAPQNVGLQDHYAAISWIRDNIAFFGGDPSLITIAGQSSGAVSAANWAYAHADSPIVAGTISHSGNQFSFPTNTLDLAAKNWFTVTSALGCGNSTSTASSLTCMRSPNITFQAILDAVKLVPSTPGNNPARSAPPFQATQDNLTFFSTAQYIARAKAGQMARIPYFQTHNDHESGFYRISALAGNITLEECAWRRFEDESFTCPTAAEAYYRSLVSSSSPPSLFYSDGNRKDGKSRSNGDDKGITTYRARYMADFENTRLYTSPSSGAYHGVEINVITGNSEAVSGIPPSESQKELTSTMQKAWGAFARDPERGLQKEVGWPAYYGGKGTLIRIGSGSEARVEFVSPGTYDGVCGGLSLDFWDGAIGNGGQTSPGCS